MGDRRRDHKSKYSDYDSDDSQSADYDSDSSNSEASSATTTTTDGSTRDQQRRGGGRGATTNQRKGRGEEEAKRREGRRGRRGGDSSEDSSDSSEEEDDETGSSEWEWVTESQEKREKERAAAAAQAKDEAAMHTAGKAWDTNEPLIKATELEFGPVIAKGIYGTVYKGRCRGQTVAIKLLHDQHLSAEKLDELKQEVMIMSQLRHPGILLLMGVCTEPNNIALVMEYVEGKSLDKILANKEINFTNAQKVKLAMDIAAACHWLHCLDPPIIHRDIKPANILVDRNFKVSVCDFGLSCVKETPNPFDEPRDEVVGSPLWMAPEVLQGWPNTEKSDVYAFALVLWEVFTRMPPNIGVDNVRRLVKDVVNKARRPPLPDDLFPPLRQLIKNAWDQNPDRRPDFAEIREILKSIFVDMVIFDPVGNAMWRALEKKEAIEEHWPMSVAWDDFAHELFSLLGQSTEGLNRSNDIGYLCLRTLLSERYQDLTSSQQHSKLKVTAERFGNFLECFGPLTDENATYNIVERFKRICENEWFHGNLSFEDSELRLRGKPQGSFLVRLSSTNACFTISKVNLNGSITHQRIVRANGRYITQVNEHQMKESDSLPGIIEAVKNDINLIHPCGDGRLFGILFNTIESGGYLKMNPNLVLSLSSSTLSPSSSSPTLPPSISSPSLQPPTPQPPKKEQPAPQQQRAPSGLPPAMSKEKRTAMERMYDSYEVMREEIMEQVEEVAEDDEDSDSSDADAEDSEEEEEGSSGSDSEEEEGTEDAEQSQPERQSQTHVEEVEQVEDSDEESDSDEDSDDEQESSKESGAAAKPKSRLLNGGDKQQQQQQQQKTGSNGQLSPHSACSSPKKASPASSSRSCIDLSLHSSNSLLAQKNFMKKFQQKQLQKSGSTNVSPPSPTRGRTTSLTTRSPTSLPSRAADSNRNKEGTKLTQSGSLVALNNHVHNIHNATKRFASKKGLSPSGAASRPK